MMKTIHFRHIASKLAIMFALTSVLVVLTLQIGAAAISLWQAPTSEQIGKNLVAELDVMSTEIKVTLAYQARKLDKQDVLFSQLAESIYAGEMKLNREFEEYASYTAYISTIQAVAFYDNKGELLKESLCQNCEIMSADEYLAFAPNTEIEPLSAIIALPFVLEQEKPNMIDDDRDQTVWLHYPVKDNDGANVLGHVLIQMFIPSIESFMLPMLIETYFRDLPEILLFSLLVGALVGFIISRGIIKRILHISEITKAWAQGNLTLRISDGKQDELNNMSNDMNAMARDLQQWLRDRESMVMQEERTRVARDLHDTVKQKMFALQMQLSSAKQVTQQDSTKQEAAQQFIEQALQLVRDSQEDLKSIIYALRPISLEQKGLKQAMRDYIQQWQARTGICVDSNLNIRQDLSIKLEDTLYNIFQELMANIERHAQAKRVKIILSSDMRNLVLTIEDDGIGFDDVSIKKEDIDTSTGLQSIRERLNEQHGQLDMMKNSNQGTRMLVSIRLHDC